MKLYTTFADIRKTFMEYNTENGIHYGIPSDKPTISAIIVYKQSNFNSPYSEHDRSYRIDNLSGKAFFSGMSSNSIYGDCLDENDIGMQIDTLDCYDWDIEKCYFE